MPALLLFLALLLSFTPARADSPAGKDSLAAGVKIDPHDTATGGQNPYFVFLPGFSLSLSGLEQGKETSLAIAVLRDMKTIDGVLTRVVQETRKSGASSEVIRYYVAMSKTSKDIYCLGRDVTHYQGKEPTDHDGSWMAGQGGARAGLYLPGNLQVGQRYGRPAGSDGAMIQDEVVSMSDSLDTPAGSFKKVIAIKESNPLNPGVIVLRYFARGLGPVKENGLELVE